MRSLRPLVAGPLVAAALAGAAVPASAAGPDPQATLAVTKPVQIPTLSKETPIPTGGTSYYCAVGVVVPFDDLPGWKPVSASFVLDGAPSSVRIGEPPYGDLAAINGLRFAPVGGAHQVLYGDFSYSQGGSPSVLDNCAGIVSRTEPRFGDTATVTYEHTAVCSGAISRLLSARTAVDRAAKRARNTEGRAHTAAVKALRKAKTRRTVATKAFTANCR